MCTDHLHLALLGPIGMPEMIVIAAVGLLIFGRKLPEVGRSLGKSIVEFKKGLSEVKHQVNDATKDLPTKDDILSDSPQENGGIVSPSPNAGPQTPSS